MLDIAAIKNNLGPYGEMMSRTCLILSLVLFMGAPFVCAQKAKPAYRAFDAAIGTASRKLEKTHKSLETKRRLANAASRVDPQGNWHHSWQKTSPSRSRIHKSYLTLAKRLENHQELNDREKLELTFHLLTAWVKYGEVDLIRQNLAKEVPQLAKRLATCEDSKKRRDFLNLVALRNVGCPGGNDLDVLVEVAEWEVLFLAALDGQKKQLQTLSTDLIFLFTDRNAGGIRKSSAGYYKVGLFLDRGFKKDLRDKSNQVRHFAWAFRMFSASNNHKAIEGLLRLKETRDARTRKLKINQADLKLNKCARLLVEKIKNKGKPLKMSAIPKLLRSDLGGTQR